MAYRSRASQFFWRGGRVEEVQVERVYKLPNNTTITKYKNGVEVIEVDYPDTANENLAMPKKATHTLHPGGRVDCHLDMNTLSIKKKDKE